VFLDGNSNLVIRATREGDKYIGGKVLSDWRGAAGTTWEARVRLQPLAGPCWPMTGNGSRADADIGMTGWHGDLEWMPSRPHVSTSSSYPMGVDDEWHTWRYHWDENRVYFWTDYTKGTPPSFDIPARSIPQSRTLPVLNLTAPGSGAVCPAQMLVDWVRVW
jgi:hypothetical protein